MQPKANTKIEILWKSFFASSEASGRPIRTAMSDPANDKLDKLPTPSESGTYKVTSQHSGRRRSRLKIALVATAGVLAGGLAAAWYYRRTVSLFRSLPEGSDDSNFGIFPTSRTGEHSSDFDPEI